MRFPSQGQRVVRIQTLGCPKNTVDSEFLAGRLSQEGFSVTDQDNGKQVYAVIINTCGFIHDAKEQSVDAILENMVKKEKGLTRKVFAIGCLAQRYKSELIREVPEIDGVFGLNEIETLAKELGITGKDKLYTDRFRFGENHFAYLKISDGCDRRCSFCAIPYIKGKHVSRPVKSLAEEAEMLAEKGAGEIILIAQDLTSYGKDLYGKPMLPALLSELSAVKNIRWIRLHYVYPTGITDELTEAIKHHSKICRYIDIPLQHISDRILRSMKRGLTKQKTIQIIEKLRKNFPEIAIRTSFITGYPGETTAEYLELKQFISNMEFERMGIFKYSHEEGTPAFALQESVNERTKNYRFRKLMEIQQEISYKKNKEKTGSTTEVVIDKVSKDTATGRTQYDSPEIDNEVIIRNPHPGLKPGILVRVQITEADIYDLYGNVIS